MKQDNSHIGENYFEELENKILSKVQSYEKKRHQRIEILTKVVLPSALILFFLSGGFLFFQNSNNTESQSVNYLAYNEVVEYLDISDYEVDALAQEYDGTTIATSDNATDIIDYLSNDESIDYDLITENQ